MRLILHIGTEKTGTKTLQSFLKMNAAVLSANGIALPATLGTHNHRRLASMVNNPDIVDDYIKEQGLLDTRQRLVAREQWQQQFIQEVQQSNAESMLVTSEHLQSRLRSPAEMQRLSLLLSGLFSSIRVVVYLRDPLSTVLALYSTAIKSGGTLKAPPMPGESAYFDHVVNHEATLKRWSAVFGQQNLRVRLFDQTEFLDGDLITDFVDACQLPKLHYRRPDKQNESLSAVGAAILSRVNQRVPKFCDDGLLNPLRGGVVKHFERNLSNGMRVRARSEWIDAYQDAFAESNEWVRTRFFPQRQRLFSHSRAKAPGQESLPEAEIDAIAGLIADVWVDSHSLH